MPEENTTVGWEFPPEEDSPPEESYQTMTAFETWIKALTSPNLATYKAIVNDPGASLGKAVLWLLLASLISGILVFPEFPLMVGFLLLPRTIEKMIITVIIFQNKVKSCYSMIFICVYKLIRICQCMM